ncbi:MAG: radical SAM protein [Desulfomonilaceae bacterium]|nr:radical SAM protein [Desulfomonilaceae bacterium]
MADISIDLYRNVDAEDMMYWDKKAWESWRDRNWVRSFYDKYRRGIEKSLLDLVASNEIDIIAFTVNSYQKHMSLLASAFFKKRDPSALIMFGGVECSPFFSSTSILEEETGAPDMICRGEAEKALPQFLREFQETGDYRVACRGFAYNDKGTVIDLGEPELPKFSTGSIMPDWTQCDFSLYTRPGDFAVCLSRGCPNACAFCCNKTQSGIYRMRKPEDVIAEIEHAYEVTEAFAPHPFVHFADLLINANMSKLMEFCDMALRSPIRFEWQSYARFNPKMDRAALEKMRMAGCKNLCFGLESASQRVIDLMNKDYDISVARRIIRDAADVRIEVLLYLIVGFPGETIEDLVTTILFVYEFNDIAYFNTPTVLKANTCSPIGVDPDRWGITFRDYDGWYSNDLRNDPEVRLFRQFVLGNAVENDLLTTRSIFGWQDLSIVDFNSPAVASEISGVLYEFWKRGAGEDRAREVLAELASGESTGSGLDQEALEYWHPENVPRDMFLGGWFAKDKNTETQRKNITKLTLNGLRALRRQVLG